MYLDYREDAIVLLSDVTYRVSIPYTPSLYHWLPVRQRIRYKVAMTVYKCLHDWRRRTWWTTVWQSLPLLACDTFGRWHRDLSVPRTRTTLGMRSFAVAGPFIWNSLPAALLIATLSPFTYARHLKAHLFG